MNQKKLVWRQLKKAGLLESENQKIREFVKLIRNKPSNCWKELIYEFRANYYDCFDEIIPILAKIDDPLIQMILIKSIDVSKPKEEAIIKQIAMDFDPENNPVLLKQISSLKIKNINNILKKRKLPENLKRYLHNES